MTRSLVICLLLSGLAGIAATAAALVAGWGWLAAFAIYSAAGSASLMAALAVQASAPSPVRAAPARDRRAKEKPAYA